MYISKNSISICGKMSCVSKDPRTKVPTSSEEVVDGAISQPQTIITTARFKYPASTMPTMEQFSAAMKRRDINQLSTMLNILGRNLRHHEISSIIIEKLFECRIYELVAMCIQNGAKCTNIYIDGMSALHMACQFGAVGCVAEILPMFVNVNILDSNGRTPLDYVCDLTTSESMTIEKIMRDRGGIRRSTNINNTP